jgi:hypothetical protein
MIEQHWKAGYRLDGKDYQGGETGTAGNRSGAGKKNGPSFRGKDSAENGLVPKGSSS